MTTMRKILALLAVVLALNSGSDQATAQSNCSYIVYGAVLTAGQWNACFAAKQNVLGYTPVNKAGDSMLGKLVTLGSGTGGAGLNLPQGAAPTSPVNGDMWTTSAGLYIRVGGMTIGPIGTGAVVTGRKVASGTTDTATFATDSNGTIAWTSVSTSAKTQTLYTCNSGAAWSRVTIVDEVGTAATYAVSVTPAMGDTILKSASAFPMNNNFVAQTFQCDGANNWLAL